MTKQANEFAFSKDRETMTKRKSFMQSLFKLKHTDMKNGYLKKLTTKGYWQERWFVIHGHYLSYFRKHIDTAQYFDLIRKPAGSINLWHVSTVTVDGNKIVLDFQTTDLGRELNSGENHYILKARDPETAREWVNAMQQAPLESQDDNNLDSVGTPIENEENSNDESISNSYFVHSICASVGANEKMETLISHAYELLDGGRPVRLLLKKVVPGVTVQVNVSKVSEPETIVGTGTFDFPEEASATARRQSLGKGGQLSISIVPTDMQYEELNDCVVLLDWSTIDIASLNELNPSRRNSESHISETSYFSLIRKLIVSTMLLGFLYSGIVYVLHVLMEVELHWWIGCFAIWFCWLSGLVTPDCLFRLTEKWYLPKLDDDLSLSKYMVRRAHIVDKQVRSARVYSVSTKRENATQEDDISISEFELEMVKELQDRLTFLRNSSIPKTAISKPLYVPQNVTQHEAQQETNRSVVYKKHVLQQFRLVRFLRATDMNLDKAEKMALRSLQWRIKFGADSITSTFIPDRWLLNYCVPKELLEYLDEDKDRRRWYLRDRDGHLTMFMRSGPMDWKSIYEKLNRNDDLLMSIGVWALEILRQDLDKLHQESKGRFPSYATLVFDLQDFSLKLQIPIQRAIKIARKYFDIIATAYPELLHRVVIVNAPWLFYSIWHTFAPLLPKEMVEKISINGHGNLLSHLLQVCDSDNIPMYLGGTLTVGEDPFCAEKLPPSGPWFEDKGASLLAK